ncbi:hypothetical protein VE03_10296 [Pseudogymnoascus sp. 23342-1-I1]|nr:hypothetical protein VE03_10296 [Pseudogymnoascus sp. 23342-1-I1]
MSSPWKNNQPEVVADRVLRRAEVSKMARKLQNRLALAQFKAKHGWEDLTLDLIEPKVDEHLRRQRPSFAGDMLSDTSSSSASERTVLSSSPLKAPFFSDALDSSSGSSGHRKRSYNAPFHDPASHSTAHKRFRSSPSTGRSISQGHTSWKDQHQLSQSFLIKSSNSDKLPTNNSNNISRSSPPRTPPPRHRAITRRTTTINNATLTIATPPRKSNGGEEGADLSGFGGGGPHTPSQTFDFADFVNITPRSGEEGG